MKLETAITKNTRFNIQNVDMSVNLKTTYPISKVQTAILVNRLNAPITNSVYEEYMFNKLNIFKDLYSLKDVDVAGKIISQHLDEKSHILIVSDYDCDGITSAIVIYKMLKEKLGKTKNVSVLINQRVNGNGYTRHLMSEILSLHSSKHVDLIISSDHGSSNNEQFIILKEAGIKMVITDHHQIPDTSYLPDDYVIDNASTKDVTVEEISRKFRFAADAFVNNQRVDSKYHTEVSGCFIAFLTMLAAHVEVTNNTVDDSMFNDVFPYVAISTISDVMSMALPINRYIVKTGLNELNSARAKKWGVIKSVVGITGIVTPRDIGFKIAPLINTASRLNCERLAFDMLVENDPELVYAKACLLAEKSDLRKSITRTLTKEAMKDIVRFPYKNSIVAVIKTDVEINGIVAANLGTARNKPTVCFIQNRHDENILSGSCRSIVNEVDIFNILKTLQENHSDIIIKFGGHKGAAGCSIYKDKIDVFRELFDKYAGEQLLTLKPTHEITVDAVLPDTMLTPILSKVIESCGPYGKDWTEPIFLTKLKVLNIYITGSIARLVFLRKDNTEIEGVHFFAKNGEYTLENIKEDLPPYSDVLVAYNMYVNCYNEVYSNTLSIIDILKVGEYHG